MVQLVQIPPYSHSAFMIGIYKYYSFLCAFYLPDNAVRFPPPFPGGDGTFPSLSAWTEYAHSVFPAGIAQSPSAPIGWPRLDPSVYGPYGIFGPEATAQHVIDLLRHIPYIVNPSGNQDPVQAAGEITFIDYHATSTLPPPQNLFIPHDTVGLAHNTTFNPTFILDTTWGVIYWYQCPNWVPRETDIEAIEDNPYDYAPLGGPEWRAESFAWPIDDFFQVLIELFLKFDFVPISGSRVLNRRIYRKHWDLTTMTLIKELQEQLKPAGGWSCRGSNQPVWFDPQVAVWYRDSKTTYLERVRQIAARSSWWMAGRAE